MKKLIAILLICGAILCTCACKDKSTDKTNDEAKSESAAQPTAHIASEPIRVSDVKSALPVFEALMFSMQENEYSAENSDFVFGTFAYILQRYGYGTLADENGNIESPDDENTKLTKKQAQILMQTCFGKDAVLPKVSEKYFTEKKNSFVLNKDYAAPLLSSKIENFAISGDKASLTLMNSKGEAMCMCDFAYGNSDSSSPYPLYITSAFISG